MLDDQINIEVYNLQIDHPNNDQRGGVCEYFKEYISILRRGDLCNLCLGFSGCEIRCLYRSLSQISHEFHTFCSNLYLFLFNVNDSDPASSIAIADFNAKASKWWSSDKQTFEGPAIHSLTTFAGYTQLIDQLTRC